jgi:hypothetical protein
MHVTDEHPPERDVEEMEERTERLEREISDAKQDWERKRSDPGVPGALEPDEDDDAA